jgi:predicted PurR-regulated permease PerM
MELSALTILLAVLVGGAVGGIFGLLLAIPVTACAKIILEEFGTERRRFVPVTPDPKRG